MKGRRNLRASSPDIAENSALERNNFLIYQTSSQSASNMGLFANFQQYVGPSQLLTVCLILGHVNGSLVDLTQDDAYFEVLSPPAISYTYKIRYARNFGTFFKQYLKHALLVPTVPAVACTRLNNADEIRGNVALVARGECSFVSKAVQVEAAGAAGVLISDQDEENDYLYVDMVHDDTGRDVAIPAAYLLGKDGANIRKALATKTTNSKAIINIPLNVTSMELHRLRLAPWNLW